jgi:DHA1 family multidrug resistance protein-like MFS transporter
VTDAPGLASAAVTEITPEDEARYRRIILAIASGAFLASFAMNFWWPFLPLFLRQIGATSDANALFWVGTATTVQGMARLVSGPAWGVISDRYGRKLMLIRALYAATLTTAIAAVAHAPWVVVVALSMQGLFSGFIPAAIALTSVSVPDARLNRSLGVVTGGQYLGSTLGPAAGALLAIGFGYRGAIVASAVLPALAATWIIFAVPRDRIAPRLPTAPSTPARRLRPSFGWLSGFSTAFWVAVVLYFGLFALNQFVRVATPVALDDIVGADRARGVSGIAFSLAGAAAVAGVTVVARWMSGRASLRETVVVFTLLSAAAMPALAAGHSPWLYGAGFLVFALVNAASMPAINTLIAATVEPARRGTAFGLASSAQAVAFMAGPMGAAAFAAISLPAGFLFCAGAFLVLTALAALGIRERPRTGPRPDATTPEALPCHRIPRTEAEHANLPRWRPRNRDGRAHRLRQ